MVAGQRLRLWVNWAPEPAAPGGRPSPIPSTGSSEAELRVPADPGIGERPIIRMIMSFINPIGAGRGMAGHSYNAGPLPHME